MPTKIILKETGKILDTSPDMNIEFKINSPIYEREAGSQTISDVLPNSVENKKSIGFVGRTDRIDKPKDLLPVIIEDGIYIRNGEMHISGATEQGIQFSIGMDESLLYANIKNKRIKDLENFPAYIPWDGYSERQKIENCISHLNNQRLDVNAPLTYFSVLLEDEMIQTGEGEEVIENRVPFVVNPTRIVDATTEFTDYLVWESRNLPIAIDGEVFHIQTIDGYGIAPFCKIWKIIEIIFENLGYHVAENVFFSHEQLRTLTSLHNVVDAICRGQINFRDLMPDMTIQKFLDALYYKFGALFLINSNDRTVRVRLLKDILANMSHKDVTALKSSPLAWVNVPSKQVSLKMNTSLKYAAPPSERIEDFINKYGNTIARTSFITTGSLTPNPNLEGIFSIVQDVETGLYYKQFGALQERGFQLLGSDFFNWDKLTANTEYETLDSTDESVPNIIIPNYGAFNINYDYSVPAYLKGRRHIYSQTEFDDTDKKSESNEKEPENLAFVFYYGRINSVSLNVRDGDQSEVVRESYFFASSLLPTRLTPTEKDKFPFSLTSRSLYDYFWRDWDICLRYSNQEYTGTFAMSKLDCLTFDMSQKLLLDNQPFLPAELSFSMNGINRKKEVELKLKSLKPFGTPGSNEINIDYNEIDDIYPGDQEFTWYHIPLNTILNNQQTTQNIRNNANQFVNETLAAAIYEDFQFYRIVSRDTINEPTTDDTDSFGIPTEEDFLSNRTEIKTYQGSARVEFRYMTTYGGMVDPVWFSYFHDIVFDYEVEFTIERNQS